MIPTAEEYLKKLDEEYGTIWAEDDESICKAFIDFAQLHVENFAKLLEESNITSKEYLEIHVNAYPKN